MQRLNIEKNEAVADLIERILEVQDREVVLVVPKGSRLTDSQSNFRLIAREAGVLAKEISIESVDETVLAAARAAGLASSHPLFGQRGKGSDSQSLSDILPRGGKRKVNGRDGTKEEKKLKVVKLDVSSEDAEGDEGESEDNETNNENDSESEPEVLAMAAEHEEIYGDGGSTERDRVNVASERYDTLDEPSIKKSGWGKKLIAWVLAAIIIVGAGMWLTAYAFGKANVTITFQAAPWSWNGTMTASVAAKTADASSMTVPAELTTQPETLTKLFPATGHSTGGLKATATITIVNDFSAASQELVATTRFETPSGLIFHLDNDTVVPGATVVNGVVTATSSINATVTADQPGASYNVGPTPHLTIPGFANTSKANGFYGVLANGASGGSSTGGTVPSASDIQSAESQMQTAISNAFQTTFLNGIPSGFKVLPQATNMASTTFNVGTAVDAQGQFSITASTVFNAIEFRTSDVDDLLSLNAGQQNSDKVLQNINLTYNTVNANFASKQLTFTLSATGTLAPQFDPDAFAATIAGKSQSDARAAVLALPDLSDAKISLWPAWLWALPKNPTKINVTVQ